MIIGFGKTEKEAEKKIANEIWEKCQNLSEKNAQNIKNVIDKIKEKYKKEGKETDEQPKETRRERYTTFYYYLMEYHSSLFYVDISFCHTNTKHPFSPDGYAGLFTNAILKINFRDGKYTLFTQ
jgi:hypothetical protein